MDNLAVRRDRERTETTKALRLSKHIDFKVSEARRRCTALIFDKSVGKKRRKKEIWVDQTEPSVLQLHYQKSFDEEQKSQGALHTHEKVLHALDRANRLVVSTDQRLKLEEEKRNRRKLLKKEELDAIKEAAEEVSLQAYLQEQEPFIPSHLTRRRTLESLDSPASLDEWRMRRVSSAPPRRPHVAERKRLRIEADFRRRDELAQKVAVNMECVTARHEKERREKRSKALNIAAREKLRMEDACFSRTQMMETSRELSDRSDSRFLSGMFGSASFEDKRRALSEKTLKNRERVEENVLRRTAIRNFARQIGSSSKSMDLSPTQMQKSTMTAGSSEICEEPSPTDRISSTCAEFRAAPAAVKPKRKHRKRVPVQLHQPNHDLLADVKETCHGVPKPPRSLIYDFFAEKQFLLLEEIARRKKLGLKDGVEDSIYRYLKRKGEVLVPLSLHAEEKASCMGDPRLRKAKFEEIVRDCERVAATTDLSFHAHEVHSQGV